MALTTWRHTNCMPKPASDLERYLAGEFAEEHDLLTPYGGRREPKASGGLDFWNCPRGLLRLLRTRESEDGIN